MKTYKFVEVPLIGYTLTEKTWSFGYWELFKKNYDVEVYLSEESNLKTLESIVSSEAKKGKIKTIAYGIGTAGTAATASSAIASILGLVCSGGACPLWLGAMYATVAPLAWVPIAATGGFVIAKRLGGRKGLQYLNKSLSKPKLLDYGPIANAISKHDLETKTTEYYLSKIAGTRKEKIKSLFLGDSHLKAMKKDLERGFTDLTNISYEMFMDSKEEEKELYKAINKTYAYIRKGFSGKIFRARSYITFGV